MNHGLNLGTVAVIAVLLGLAGFLIGCLLAYRNRSRRHSRYRSDQQGSGRRARAEPEQPGHEEPAPAGTSPPRSAREHAQRQPHAAETPTEIISCWPSTDPDHGSETRDTVETIRS